MNKDILYLDNATTSYPKAPGLAEEMSRVMTDFYASPNRSSYSMAKKSNNLLCELRSKIASFVGCKNPNRMIFTAGATHSLNIAIKGFLKNGDHVISTAYDHNAVLRPLNRIRKDGVEVTIVKHSHADHTLVEAISNEYRPQTKLVILPWVSNVTGVLLPVKEIIDCAHQAGIFVLIDAAQSVGHIPVELDTLSADMIAFGGHKGLLGPFGIGCLIVNNSDIILEPLIEGGTGFDSQNENYPIIYPQVYEPGTYNLPVIAALGKSLEFISNQSYHEQLYKVNMIWKSLIEELSSLNYLRFLGRYKGCNYIPIASFTMSGLNSNQIAETLDKRYDIQVRAGLHCAPFVHEMFHTLPDGAVRISPNVDFTIDKITVFKEALEEISERKQSNVCI